MNPSSHSFPASAKGHPLTAPAVMPVMICRDANSVKMIGGMASSIPVAIMTPHSTLNSLMLFTIRMGTVLVSRSLSAEASRYSFQAIQNVKIAAAARPGFISGKTTRKNTWNGPAPSTRAASSSE